MGFFILIGFLAAYGALSVLWAGLGWLLPGMKGCAVVYMGTPNEGVCRRYRWLRGLGLFSCPLIAVAEGEATEEIEVCSREELLARLTWEAERFGGTGT